MIQVKSLLDVPTGKSINLVTGDRACPECPVGKTLKALEVKRSKKNTLIKVCIYLHPLVCIESFLLFAEEYLIFTEKHRFIKWAFREMIDRKTAGIALIQAELLSTTPLEIEVFIGDKRYCKISTASAERSRLLNP